MPAFANLTLAHQQYAAPAIRPPADQLMAADVVWDITPGFPLGGVYEGLTSVQQDFLGPLASSLSSITAHADTFYEAADDHVVVLGHYRVETLAGQTDEVRFVHVWTIRDGKLAHLHQVADSALLDRERQPDLH